MKTSIISTIMAVVIGLTATAQAELNLAAVNMQDLFTKFYKRAEAEKRVNEQKAAVEKDIQTRQEKLQKLITEFQEVKKKYDDPSLSDTARKNIGMELQMKQNVAQAEEQEFKSFVQRRQLALNETNKREVILILTEIQKTVEETAAKADYDFVFDSSAISDMRPTLVLLYVKKSHDITPEVLKKLNATAPAGFDPEKLVPVTLPAAQ